MLVFAFSATGCNAVMPDRIIGSNPEQEYGDNNYMQWARETLAAIDRDLRI
ncbi:alpha-1,6-mannanase, partial [Alistipes onderdonkii]